MTYHFTVALVGSLGGRIREVRVDRLIEVRTPQQSMSMVRGECSLSMRVRAMR
jgi:hypothetical protein